MVNSATESRKTGRAERTDPSVLAAGIRAGERAALARGITLVESSRADHQEAAQELLAQVLDLSGKAVRIGLSGAPGVGKSTFTEAFGRYLIDQGLKVAVLAVDPSSARTGGSILGDKTRMEFLARDPSAFIRPSPSGGTLGGVARRTREAMLLAEAAGYDVVIIETVGVGQSETAVADMVDMFLLLLSPGGGDELQGIKRGIMELADLVVVNKADGDLKPAARRAAAEYGAALHLMRPKSPNWTPEVALASALKSEGLEEIWGTIQVFREKMSASGELEQRRSDQARTWMWTELREGLLSQLHTHAEASRMVSELEQEVAAGTLTPTAAANRLLALLFPDRPREYTQAPFEPRVFKKPFALPRTCSDTGCEGCSKWDEAMSRRCELTGKAVMTGNNVSHANNKTRRRFLPNLCNVTLMSEKLGRQYKLKISAHALRSVEHRGGLDGYLRKARDSELSTKAQRIKREIAKAEVAAS
eukprot:s1_g268.t1